ncbi:MAG: hypothetical protein AAGE59_02360 [Cyanobacteria bacterium P01_F01_bin.86]
MIPCFSLSPFPETVGPGEFFYFPVAVEVSDRNELTDAAIADDSVLQGMKSE